MYYDDEARRFNFVSGLLLGAILGTGVALLARPQQRLGKPKRLQNSAKAVKKATRRRLDAFPDSIAKVRRATERVGR
jgi:gas vesicle protein